MIGLRIFNLHLQIRFPFRIVQLRIVNVPIFGNIARCGNGAKAACAHAGARGKNRGNEKEQQKQKGNNPKNNGMALDEQNYPACDFLGGNSGFFGRSSGTLGFPCGFGILALDFLLLPHSGQPIFL